MTVELNSGSVLSLVTSAYADYSEYNSGALVQLPAVDGTFGSVKVAVTVSFQKKPAGSAPSAGLGNLFTILGAAYSDVAAFEAGQTVTLPKLDEKLGADIVEVTITLQKVA